MTTIHETELILLDDLFRASFRAHALPVAIVTADVNGRRVGATVTSVVSVSRQPPMLSMNFSRGMSTFATFSEAQFLAVHFLDECHRGLAESFATSGIDRFHGIEVTVGSTGAPVLDGVARVLEVEVETFLRAGDSHVVVAVVRGGRCDDTGRPLLYHAGRYRSFATVENVYKRDRLPSVSSNPGS